MGYIPPLPPLQLNVDAQGIPQDYATYAWLMYGKRVEDNSPARRAFLFGPGEGLRAPRADPRLMDVAYR